jgi:hypothetical protein
MEHQETLPSALSSVPSAPNLPHAREALIQSEKDIIDR